MKTLILMGLVLLAGEPAPAQSSDALEAAPSAAATRTGADWAEDLEHEDLSRREQAYAELLEQAGRDPATRRQIEAWAAGDGPLGWTGRLALRELELRERLEATPPRGLGSSGLRRVPAPPSFGVDPFGFDPFGFDPFGLDPGGRDLFRDLEDRLGSFLDQTGSSSGHQSSESFRMESGPDGVKVEVREREGDDQTTRTYEAESLEALLEAHPELRGRLNVGTLEPGWNAGFGDLLNRLRQRRGLAPFGAQRIGTETLGVLMRPPGDWSASIDGLEQGTGLYVERVFPGTLAAELGIRTGDILVSLNGRTLRGAEDVRAVLAERAKLVGKAPIEAEVLDASGQRRSLRWTPPDYETRTL